MKAKLKKYRVYLIALLGLIAILSLRYSSFTKSGFIAQYSFKHSSKIVPQKPKQSFYEKLAEEAEKRTKISIKYDGAYYGIDYPMGDVPENIGVCTDVLIRSYRELGIDLQEKIHLDMKENFLSYPKMWLLTSTDTNIDHRRVPNMMTFFNRSGSSLPITQSPHDYAPGDIVSWNLGRGVMHIGIISNQLSKTGIPLVVHNIGSGPKLEDVLFSYKIIGHHRYGATR